MLFGRNGSEGVDGNGDRAEAPSGLTMLHQAMLHTSTTLSETLDRGLTDVKTTNTEAHTAVTKELARMTRALQDTQKQLPMPYADRDRGRDTADQLHQLHELVTAVRETLVGVAQDVADLAPVPDGAAVAVGARDGYDTAAETLRADRSLLGAVPQQRGDSITDGAPPAGEGPVAWEGPAPEEGADRADVPAVEAGAVAESEPDGEDGAQIRPERETPLTRGQVAEAVREVLAEQMPAPLTRDQVADAVREVVAAALPSPGPDASDASSALAELGGQITALRAEVAGLAERLAAAPHGEAEEQGRPAPDPEHGKVLTQAAGISSAVLVCHRDLWELLSGWAGGHPHFRMPPQIADQGENRIAANISGRSLIAVLISLSRLRHTAAEGDGDRELAEAVYQRIGNSLAALSPDDGPLVTITLDDRTSHTGKTPDA